MTEIRWAQVEDEPQGALFADEELVERHVGTGEFRGLEFLHVNARRIVNEVPAASSMPFRYTINAYRGCSHACSYTSWSWSISPAGRWMAMARAAPSSERRTAGW